MINDYFCNVILLEGRFRTVAYVSNAPFYNK